MSLTRLAMRCKTIFTAPPCSYGPRAYFQTQSVAYNHAAMLMGRGYINVRVLPYRTGYRVSYTGVRIA